MKDLISKTIPARKGKGFFKKSEKERLKIQLNKKTKKLKRQVVRGEILSDSLKSNQIRIKTLEEKKKKIEEICQSLSK